MTNVQFHCADLLEWRPTGEPFDYVIAHGFISWVPEPVCHRVFELCRDHLAPHGVVLVSYNALPRVLSLDNIPSRADGADTMLILNRIGGDLTSTASTLTNVFGLFYDDTENSLSFGFNPRVCQFRSSISSSFPRSAPRFDQAGGTGPVKASATSPSVNL